MPSDPNTFHIESRDAQGRKYLRCSPALLDSLKHVKRDEMALDERSVALLIGVPVYRRETMPEGWPDA